MNEAKPGAVKGRFPFGRPSLVRPPRTPQRDCKLFVLAVYPSALHVRWTLPRWAPEHLGVARSRVGALAVDVEPEVFWDGEDADDRVDAWKDAVAWRDGDGAQDWGRVVSAMNGTSGVWVRDNIVHPQKLSMKEVWLTDAVPWFFIKRGTAQRPQQHEVITHVYDVFARAVRGLKPAELPARPTARELTRLAIETQRQRLRNELLESGAPAMIQT